MREACGCGLGMSRRQDLIGAGAAQAGGSAAGDRLRGQCARLTLAGGRRRPRVRRFPAGEALDDTAAAERLPLAQVAQTCRCAPCICGRRTAQRAARALPAGAVLAGPHQSRHYRLGDLRSAATRWSADRRCRDCRSEYGSQRMTTAFVTKNNISTSNFVSGLGQGCCDSPPLEGAIPRWLPQSTFPPPRPEPAG